MKYFSLASGCSLQVLWMVVCLQAGLSQMMAFGTFPGDSKWGADQVGTPATVTWSLILEGTGTSPEFQSLGYWGGTSELNRVFYSLEGYASNAFSLPYDSGTTYALGQTIFRTALENAFDAWSDVANVTFVEVADSGLALGHTGTPQGGAIRIGAYDLTGATGSSPYYNAGAWGFEPPNGTSAFANLAATEQVTSLFGDMTLNSAGFFFSSADGDYSAFAPNEIQNILSHEIGHALGLIHTADPAAIMNPGRSVLNLALGADDIAGVQYLYGAAVPEPFMPGLLGMAAGVYLMGRRRSRLVWTGGSAME